MTYAYTNGKGTTYYLHTKIAKLKNGREQQIYYFAKDQRAADAVESIPLGYEVSERAESGMPVLKKSAK